MSKRYKPNDVRAVINELVSENPRASAIVGGSFLDSALDHAITNRLRPLEASQEKELFMYGGPFQSCDQKIKAAFALGLIGPRTKRDIELLNEIRNVFAHDMNEVTFEAKMIGDKCGKLFVGSAAHMESGGELSNKERFVFGVQWIVDGLLTQADAGERHRLKFVSSLLSD
jgi:hypothetical protein